MTADRKLKGELAVSAHAFRVTPETQDKNRYPEKSYKGTLMLYRKIDKADGY